MKVFLVMWQRTHNSTSFFSSLSFLFFTAPRIEYISPTVMPHLYIIAYRVPLRMYPLQWFYDLFFGEERRRKLKR